MKRQFFPNTSNGNVGIYKPVKCKANLTARKSGLVKRMSPSIAAMPTDTSLRLAAILDGPKRKKVKTTSEKKKISSEPPPARAPTPATPVISRSSLRRAMEKKRLGDKPKQGTKSNKGRDSVQVIRKEQLSSALSQAIGKELAPETTKPKSALQTASLTNDISSGKIPHSGAAVPCGSFDEEYRVKEIESSIESDALTSTEKESSASYSAKSAALVPKEGPLHEMLSPGATSIMGLAKGHGDLNFQSPANELDSEILLGSRVQSKSLHPKRSTSSQFVSSILPKKIENNRAGRRLPPPLELELPLKPFKKATSPARLDHSETTPSPLSLPVTTKPQTVSRKKSNNDNFVRLNMKNGAGSCRGARNKSSSNRNRSSKKWENARKYTGDKKYAADGPSDKVPRCTVDVDPLDDFLDGKFDPKKAVASTASSSGNTDSSHPICIRHQMPCKLLTVKKTSTGNKGKKFYACAMPRGEQCDFFQWAEDTAEATRAALLKNSSESGFIARQVHAYAERFRPLTVPELRAEAKRRNLSVSGKKKELLFRLMLWARDEIAKGRTEKIEANIEAGSLPDVSNQRDANARNDGGDDIDGENDCSDFDDSDDDLELIVESTDSGVNESERTDDDSGLPDSEFVPRPPAELLRSMFGHNKFRDGQEWAIQRCYAGQRTLLVAPTGFGKSLCYSLPAAALNGICVVVSPLLSLIQDQLRSLPPNLPAATLSGPLSTAEMAAIIDDILRRRIKVLYVSPERLSSPSFRRLFRPKWDPVLNSYERPFPEISLLCIDEAHCISHWGHNFRPCFLRLKKLLGFLEPRSVLAITATAGPHVISDICAVLDIDESGIDDVNSINSAVLAPSSPNVKILGCERKNIAVSAFLLPDHESRLAKLTKLLKPSQSSNRSENPDASGCLADGSVIVYVWRQYDTEVVATHLQASGVTGGIVSYHGGMDSGARSNAQSKFMRGKARICVATVAFGLGIDKSDVAGVIHLYLSATPEHYLQEIGRAGRDGRPALAIAMPIQDELALRHSLAHADALCKSQILSLLHLIRRLVTEAIESLQKGNEEIEVEHRSIHIGVPVMATSIACDCKFETIETLLSLLELMGNGTPILEVEGIMPNRATVVMKRQTLDSLAKVEPVAKCILRSESHVDRIEPNQGSPGSEGEEDAPHSQEIPRHVHKPTDRRLIAYSKGTHTCSIMQCANELGPHAEPRHIFAAIRRLQTSGVLEAIFDVSAKGKALYLKVTPHGVDVFTSEAANEAIDQLASSLLSRVESSTSASARKVLDMYYILTKINACTRIEGIKNGKETEESLDELSSSSKLFHQMTKRYFADDGLCADDHELERHKDVPKPFLTFEQREVKLDASALLNDVSFPCWKNDGYDPSAVSWDEPEHTDYTVLSLSKFLHGIDTPRVSAKLFRAHHMFGRWRDTKFENIINAVSSLMGHRGSERNSGQLPPQE